MVDGTRIPIGGDLAIAFAMALVSMLIAPLLDVDGDAQHLRVVRRRVRRGRRANRSEAPGVILFEIDGLGEGILREAVRDGHVPTIARSDGQRLANSRAAAPVCTRMTPPVALPDSVFAVQMMMMIYSNRLEADNFGRGHDDDVVLK